MPAAETSDSLPFAGKPPGVGDVGVEAGDEDQQQHAHLGHFAAEMFAGERVAQFVQHFHDADRGEQPEQIPPIGEHGELRQPGADFVELANDDRRREQHDERREHQGRPREEPADVAVDGGERGVGVDAAEADRRELGPGERPAAQAFGAAAVEQFVALAGGVAHRAGPLRATGSGRPTARSRVIVRGGNCRANSRDISARLTRRRSISSSACSSGEKWKCSSVSGSFTTHVDAPAISTGTRDEVGPQTEGERAVDGGDGFGHGRITCRSPSAPVGRGGGGRRGCRSRPRCGPGR